MDNIFISLSSNQNNPAGQLQTAIQKITEAGLIIKNKSHVYETEPWGMPNQDWFLNQIIELTNQDSPQKLLIKLQKIEDEMGRVRTDKYGPRIIDLVGRPKSIKAMETAMESGKSILLVAQRSAAKDEPSPEDIYATGTVANILQMLKLPDGTVKVLVEGTQRARIQSVDDLKTHYQADATMVQPPAEDTTELEAMRRAMISQFDQYVKLNKKIPPEILTSLAGIDEAGRLADTIAAHLPLKLEQKQEVLEMIDVRKRLEHLLGVMETELDILQVEKRIRGRVKKQMEKSQREYYLNEQVKAIQNERRRRGGGRRDQVGTPVHGSPQDRGDEVRLPRAHGPLGRGRGRRQRALLRQ